MKLSRGAARSGGRVTPEKDSRRESTDPTSGEFENMAVADGVAGIEPLPGQRKSILEQGRNCWRAATASRAALLVDARQYFMALAKVLRGARKSILVAGWDFDGSIVLERGNTGEAGTPLGTMLRDLVERHPELEIRILVWSTAVWHGPSSTFQLLFGADWLDHPRIDLRLDTKHPIYAAHHQKIVAVDDKIAFSGGVDLTVGRWDTRAHLASDRRRKQRDANIDGPVRDVQMIVDGDAAVALSDLARERWRIATGETLRPSHVGHDLWPIGLSEDFGRAPVGIARTVPAWRTTPETAEIRYLVKDMLRSARDLVYIETQYFSNLEIGEILLDLLDRPDGPEVIVITTLTLHSFMENLAMGNNRDRLIRLLAQAGRSDRLRVYYPLADKERDKDADVEVFVHSKVLVVDDRMVRVGSSNLNYRSFGLDTECDLIIEAADQATAATIGRLCRELMADLIGVNRSELEDALEAKGSFVNAFDLLAGRTGRLKPFKAMYEDGPTRRLPGTWIIDPERPFRLPGRKVRKQRRRETT